MYIVYSYIYVYTFVLHIFAVTIKFKQLHLFLHVLIGRNAKAIALKVRRDIYRDICR